MTDTNFLALIEQGAQAWNEWRSHHPNQTPDLSNAYLFECVLNNFNLSGVCLERACLIGASFKGANLRNANLQFVYANNANFLQADLAQATLTGGVFIEATFAQANLQQTQALGANFACADFTKARMLEWLVDETTILQDRKGAAKGAFQQHDLSCATNFMRPITQLLSTHEIESTKSEQSQEVDASINKPSQKVFAHNKLQTLSKQIKTNVNRESIATAKRSTQRFVRKHPLHVAAGAIALCSALAFNISRSTTEDLSAVAAPLTRAVFTSSVLMDLPCEEPLPSSVDDRYIAHEYDSGAQFYGTFSDGQPADGRGTMLYPTGNRYDGEYQSGQRHGCGTYSFADGRRYVGEMRFDQMSGKGTWIMANGERYIGEFEDNQCSGQGTFIFLNGASVSGIWEDGVLVGDELACDRGTLDLPQSSDL